MFTTRTRGRAAGGAALAVLTALSLAACGNKSDDGTTAAESCVDTSGDTIKLGFLNSTSGGTFTCIIFITSNRPNFPDAAVVQDARCSEHHLLA